MTISTAPLSVSSPMTTFRHRDSDSVTTVVHLLFLNPVADKAEDEIDQRVHRIIMLLASKPE
jgi:hypothetical protein